MRILFKTSYSQDIRLFKHGGYVFWYGLLAAALLAAPMILDDFYLGEMSLVFIYAIAGLGLMLLAGFTGLISIGHGAFMAVGAYAEAYFLSIGAPFPMSVLLAGITGAVVGALIAFPLKRMTSIYFAIATLAFSIMIEEVIIHWTPVTGGLSGVSVTRPLLFGFQTGEPWKFYFICLTTLTIVLSLTLNILRTPTGRALTAIRDSEISAESMGVDISKFKIIAFAVSGGFTSLAGALFAHQLGFLTPDAFGIMLSITLLMMVVVGGLGSVHGAVFGAVFVGLLPQLIAVAKDYLPPAVGEFPGLEPGLFGLILSLFIIFEPQGLYGRWLKLKLYLEMFPLYRKATFKRQKTYLKTERVK